jgi:hypothetical protein
MSLMAHFVRLPHSNLARTGVGAAVGLAAVATLSVATLSNPRLVQTLGNELSAGVQQVKSVAAMLAERSPGERPEGALASLKPKRQAMLSDHGIPKVHVPSPTAYEALAGPPPMAPVAPPPEVPLYNAVGASPVPVPLGVAATPGTSGGGPPVLSNIPLPGGGGGGGGAFTPPIITTATPEVPQTPATPVPEPATWAMMIFGFALIGRAVRRMNIAGPKPAFD